MRYNSRGQFVSGNGGPISINSSVIASVGTLAQWLDDDHVIANTPSPVTGQWALCVYAIAIGQWLEVDARGANFLAAGGGRYAAQLANQPIYGSVTDPTACLTLTGTDGRGAAAIDGTIATTPDAGRLGLQLRRTDGSVFDVPGAHIARDVYVIDAHRVIWRDDAGILHAHGVHVGPVAGPLSRPIYIDVLGVPWLVYFTAAWGVVAHPVDRLELGRVAFTGDAFHHDARVFGGGLWVGASIGQGELPGEERGVDVLTLPITDLTQTAPQDPVVAIGRDHYLAYFVGYPGAQGGWDTNDDPSSAPLPANGYLITPDGHFVDAAGTHLGTFIHGGASVDEVESQAWAIAPTGKIPIAYWDSRAWPRWPNLPGMSWLCLQAYCGKDESLPAFEADIRARINDPTRPQLPLVLVAQAFTSNASLTKNIDALVPIFSRLTAETPSMIMTLVFNGNGRSTGLQHNQHVIPLWQDYFNGITGVPDSGESTMLDWHKIDSYGKTRWIELDVQNKSQQLVDAGQDCRPFQQDCFVQITSELYHTEGVPLDLFWKAGVPDYNNPADVEAKLQHIGEDIIVDLPQNVYKDVVPSMGLPSATWNALTGELPITPGDQSRCGPPPKPEGGEVPEPEPTPVTVLIHEHPTTVHRSDPKGLPIFFEAESARPIVEIVAALNDGEPTVPLMFLPEQRRHGVYCRGFAYKPVKNGTYQLTVTATDDQGNVGTATSPAAVTVVA